MQGDFQGCPIESFKVPFLLGKKQVLKRRPLDDRITLTSDRGGKDSTQVRLAKFFSREEAHVRLKTKYKNRAEGTHGAVFMKNRGPLDSKAST